MRYNLELVSSILVVINILFFYSRYRSLIVKAGISEVDNHNLKFLCACYYITVAIPGEGPKPEEPGGPRPPLFSDKSRGPHGWGNRPLSSSKNPHFQNEARCTTFLVKMIFICMRMRLSSCPRFETEARGNSKMAYLILRFGNFFLEPLPPCPPPPAPP